MICDTFCIKPWVHMATYTTGDALMCCVAKESAGNLNKDTITQICNLRKVGDMYYKQHYLKHNQVAKTTD